jgi:Ca-activated chloride channel family protein
MYLRELVISDLTIKFPRIAISWTAIFSLVVMCVCAGMVGAQGQSAGAQTPQGDRPRPLAHAIALTVVHFSVYDRDGKRVDGLTQEAVEMFEDNVRQKPAIFSQDDAPATIGLLIDSSGSMKDKMSATTQAIRRFIQTCNIKDEFFAANFGEHVERITNAEELNAVLDRQTAGGRTAMLDALYLGLVESQRTRNSRKALLIITDGGDNRSRYIPTDLRKIVKEAGVPIYCLLIGDEPSGATQEEPNNGPEFLAEICKSSGGRFVRAKALSEMAGLAAEIGTEIRRQYALGYYPTEEPHGPDDRRWRKIEIKVHAKGVRGPLKIYAPSGYICSFSGNIL